MSKDLISNKNDPSSSEGSDRSPILGDPLVVREVIRDRAALIDRLMCLETGLQINQDIESLLISIPNFAESMSTDYTTSTVAAIELLAILTQYHWAIIKRRAHNAQYYYIDFEYRIGSRIMHHTVSPPLATMSPPAAICTIALRLWDPEKDLIDG